MPLLERMLTGMFPLAKGAVVVVPGTVLVIIVVVVVVFPVVAVVGGMAARLFLLRDPQDESHDLVVAVEIASYV